MDQLDSPDAIPLYLVVCRLELDPGGESIPGIIERIREMGVPLADMLELAKRVGYESIESAYYGEIRFRQIDRMFFRVEGSFPRIVPSSFSAGLPALGVLHLRYDVDLSAAAAYSVPRDRQDGVLDALVSGS
jgi:hypothetical protein